MCRCEERERPEFVKIKRRVRREERVNSIIERNGKDKPFRDWRSEGRTCGSRASAKKRKTIQAMVFDSGNLIHRCATYLGNRRLPSFFAPLLACRHLIVTNVRLVSNCRAAPAAEERSPSTICAITRMRHEVGTSINVRSRRRKETAKTDRDVGHVIRDAVASSTCKCGTTIGSVWGREGQEGTASPKI